MSCPYCGRPIDAGAAQCPHCGQALAAGVPDPSTPLLAPADVPSPGGSTQLGAAAHQDSSAPAVGEGTPASPIGYAPPPAWGAPPVPPAPKPRHSRVWLFAGTAVALAVVLASAGLGVLYLRTAGGVFHGAGLAFPWAASTPTPQGVVLLRDPLTSNTNFWSVEPDRPGCEFANGGLQISNGHICLAPVTVDSSSFDIVVQVGQISGSQTVPYGIVFRGNRSGDYYSFHIHGVGDWDFGKVVDRQYSYIVYWTYTMAIKRVNPGAIGATNTIEVRAKGPQFQFFINGVNVGHATDGTLSTGQYLGLECEQRGQVVFSNMVVRAFY